MSTNSLQHCSFDPYCLHIARELLNWDQHSCQWFLQDSTCFFDVQKSAHIQSSKLHRIASILIPYLYHQGSECVVERTAASRINKCQQLGGYWQKLGTLFTLRRKMELMIRVVIERWDVSLSKSHRKLEHLSLSWVSYRRRNRDFLARLQKTLVILVGMVGCWASPWLQHYVD